MGKINFKKIDITNLIKEQNEGNSYTLSQSEFSRILRILDGNLDMLSKYKPLRGRDIIIDGNVNLSGSKSKSLGPIKKINGNLDITNSEIATLKDVVVTGRVSDWGSELSKIKERKRVAALRAEAQSRREDGDWDIDNYDPIGLAAQAVFKYLQSNEPDSVLSDDDADELRGLKERLGNLYYDQEQGNDSEELQNEIDSIESEIEEIEEKIDVYSLIPSNYNFYGDMKRFEIYDGDLYGNEYVAGTESEAEAGAYEYAKQFVDDNGVTSFNQSFWESHLDEEGIVDYFRDFYYNDVRDNPEIYFDEDDFQLTDEQEERKEVLENYIEELEELLSETEQEQRDLEDSDSDEYYELDERIAEIKENIDTAQEELDDIVPDDEPTEEMIDEKVESMLEDVRYDPKSKLDEFGMSVSEWVDIEALIEDFVSTDGYGIMNGYDGSYDIETIDGENYVVMHVN